jgi:hypothetical protein
VARAGGSARRRPFTVLVNVLNSRAIAVGGGVAGAGTARRSAAGSRARIGVTLAAEAVRTSPRRWGRRPRHVGAALPFVAEALRGG